MIALRSTRVLLNTDLLPADVVIEGEYILDVLPYGSAPYAIDSVIVCSAPASWICTLMRWKRKLNPVPASFFR
jgi:hypothetical protein